MAKPRRDYDDLVSARFFLIYLNQLNDKEFLSERKK